MWLSIYNKYIKKIIYVPQINYYYFLLLIVFLGSILRLFVLIYEPPFPRDTIVYLSLLDEFQKTGYFPLSSWVLPLFSYSMKVICTIGISNYYSGITISFIAGVSLIVSCFYIAQELWHKSGISLILSLSISVHPTLIEYSVVNLRESLFLLLCSLVFLFFIWCPSIKLSYITASLSGIFFGLAIMTRYEGWELLLIIPLYIMYKMKDKNFSFVICLTRLATFLLMATLASLGVMSLSGNIVYFYNGYFSRIIDILN